MSFFLFPKVFSFFNIYHHLIPFLPPPLSPRVLSDAAVQEERQRNREREGELEFSVGVNEEMPVEKILEAETAVEQKTELHSDGGSAGNSVSHYIMSIDFCKCFHRSMMDLK